ncbi:MAG TPA: hypothetical protein VHH11_01215 [Gammaproteobacteria bacterium]|jgi:hypothetical protein|nr:hypothetical protein [Gammaproteobacteria bacterium]
MASSRSVKDHPPVPRPIESPRRIRKTGARLAAVGLAALLAGCHHGGGGDSAPPLGPDVTVTGKVTFDLVPVANIGGVWQLDYASTVNAPARGITVQVLNGANVVATTTTDDTGAYSLTVASNQNVYVRARAEMRRAGTPGWTVGVTDNTQGDSLYVYDSQAFMLGPNGATVDLHPASGWGGSSYTSARSAAPFAILDTVYDAMQAVLASAPGLSFPTLQIHWSPNNTPTTSATGPYAPTGQIGSTFYASGYGIYLLGAQDQDTDEYDRSVITQAWGQYLLDAFGRDDSVVGPSAPGDQLDMRVAFREGFATAIAAIVTGDPIYRNTQGPRQAQGFSFNVEGEPATNPNPAPGWFSERSIHELIYNLYDSNANFVPEGSATQDNVALGFGPLFSVLTSTLQTTPAQTSIFAFVNALQQAQPQEQANIDALVQSLGMNSIVDDYGSTETHFGTPPSPKLTSVYDLVTVNGGATNVCSLDAFRSTASGSIDKLGSRRYVRFSVPASGTYTLKAAAVNPPAAADPDLVLHQAGTIGSSTTAPTPACTQTWQTTPGVCTESLTTTLSPGNYVLEVYEWTNTTDDPRYPPIGDTCFDVTVSGP